MIDEVAESFIRSSFSAVVRENYDMAFSLLDVHGRQFIQTKKSIPSFIGTLPHTLQEILKKIPADQFSEGDVVISNDSWFGKWYGPHQHLANSLLRSVEFQKPLIRSTPSGITSVVDYSGKIIETIPTNKKGYLYYQHPINKFKSNCSSTLFSVSLLIFFVFRFI